MDKCIFCNNNATHIYPDFSSLNWYNGNVPVCLGCSEKYLIPKKLEVLK